MSGWEAFLGWPLRPYPVLLLGVGAVALVAYGARTLRGSRRPGADPELALLVARGLRSVILGLCTAVFAAAWLFGIGWLALLALVVAGEEMFETSVMVGALEDGARRRRARGTTADVLRHGEGSSRIDGRCPSSRSTSSSSAPAPAAT